MNNAINVNLEEMRTRLDERSKKQRSRKMKAQRKARRDAAASPGSGKRFQDLVGKLKQRDDVKDPAALAAWIGRKKFGKERFASMARKESLDVPELLVFEDVEDVIAFVEGLEQLTEAEDPVGNLIAFLRTASSELETRKWSPLAATGLDMVGAMNRLRADIGKITFTD